MEVSHFEQELGIDSFEDEKSLEELEEEARGLRKMIKSLKEYVDSTIAKQAEDPDNFSTV